MIRTSKYYEIIPKGDTILSQYLGCKTNLNRKNRKNPLSPLRCQKFVFQASDTRVCSNSFLFPPTELLTKACTKTSNLYIVDLNRIQKLVSSTPHLQLVRFAPQHYFSETRALDIVILHKTPCISSTNLKTKFCASVAAHLLTYSWYRHSGCILPFGNKEAHRCG